jgi:acyl-CoA hydrolase
MKKYQSAEEGLSILQSGHNVFIQTAAAAPQRLINAMTEVGKSLTNVSVYHLHTEGKAPYATAEMADHFNVHCFFIGANMRESVNKGIADYIPVFISEVPALFRKGIIKIDVALLHVSPPDEHGFCSLGVSVDAALAAIENAKYIIAQVNPNMPRTFGGGIIHSSRFSSMVEVNDPIFEAQTGMADETDMRIAANVASLIEDGATLQLGIGKIPDEVLGMLKDRKHLGIHSEMFSDGIIDLIEAGVITGESKKLNPGKVVSGFALGTKRLYDYINNNPMFELHDSAYINNTHIISQNPKVTAINSAIEIDITGQVCADSIGSYLYSGVGGQMDFIRGASLSEGGKPIIALPSVTKKGESKIVTELKPGSGVVTTRANVHYIVTEYGIADLYGKNIKQRIKELIKIAHPEHKIKLAAEAFKTLKIAV